ncbi:MAG: magnesium-protoporphyrin IX monomethyl ester anaerobic oxidative cyclase [Pseudomonadota bacterium]
MRILLLHPPQTAIGSRIPKENLPPLGLLAIGGPLIDAGHDVTLLNADPSAMPVKEITRRVRCHAPDAVLIGHSGSTSAHPTALEIARHIKTWMPHTKIIYGGVYPTYHWKDVLTESPDIDIIVRGKGEATAVNLIAALEASSDLHGVSGIAFRHNKNPFATCPAPMIQDLDDYRIGWELIDFKNYSYWGHKRAVVMQFSRGCPHLCTYCGQRGFWTKWRYRNPQKLAAEIAWLHREHRIELVNFADENPTSSRKVWKEFLEAIIAENIPDLIIIGSTRADDIVRDADILHLYKKAGVLRFLMGIENTDENTLKTIRKGGSTSKDKEAIRLLREHNIISLCTWAVGFEEETDMDYWRSFPQLLTYDPDQMMSIYATPHRWTPFFNTSKHRRIIRDDLRKWDYKHQALETKGVPPWRIFLWVKIIEVLVQSRPKALLRVLAHPDKQVRHGMQWYTRMGKRVWLGEIREFVTDRLLTNGPTLVEYWNTDKQDEENALARRPTTKKLAITET